ncbi:MAG: hypothetical protein ACI9CF_000944 [Candidatus Omnitrophota bacterium]|jgi:hypothetical protein
MEVGWDEALSSVAHKYCQLAKCLIYEKSTNYSSIKPC